MKKKWMKLTTSALVCTLLVGCLATPSGNSQEGGQGSLFNTSTQVNADERLVKGEQAQFFSRSGIQACAAAASVSVLACALSNSSKKLQCSIIAGVAACGVAAGANYYLEQRRNKYSNATERLQAMTADVKQDTERVAMRAETMRQVIADDKQRIIQINSHINIKNANIEASKRELVKIDKNIELMRRDAENMRKKTKNYEEVLAAEKSTIKGNKKEFNSLEKEIFILNRQVASLEEEINDLYNQRSAITLG